MVSTIFTCNGTIATPELSESEKATIDEVMAKMKPFSVPL